MNNNIITSLTAQLNRAAESIKDSVAKDGLIVLKKVLDESGFQKSEYLKDYEVYSHASDTGITFEIVLQLEAIEGGDKIKEIQEAVNNSTEDIEEDASRRTYAIISRGGFNRIARLQDKRSPATNALKPARSALKSSKSYGSAYKNADHRKLEHSIANASPRVARMPRDMHINKEGKLSIKFSKQTRTTKSGEMNFPKGNFQGIAKKFMDELSQIVASKFIPEIEKIINANSTD